MSPLYREAISCETRGPSDASDKCVLQVAVVRQNNYHELPVHLRPQEAPAQGPDGTRSSSPTAVQRLAALTANTSVSQPVGKRHSTRHRRKVSLQDEQEHFSPPNFSAIYSRQKAPQYMSCAIHE